VLAGVVELEDTMRLGRIALRAWGFESLRPHGVQS
jgi:hypothetical protein